MKNHHDPKPTLPHIVASIAEAHGFTVADVCGVSAALARTLTRGKIANVAQEHGYTQEQIGAALNRQQSAIHKCASRYRDLRKRGLVT